MSMGFLQKIFKQKPTVELLTFDPDDMSVLISCPAELGLGEQQVVAVLAGTKLTCKVMLESLEAGTYYGRFLEPTEAVPHMAALLPQPAKFVENRQAQRYERVLRVMSPAIPGYMTVTIDLSVSGMKVKLTQPLEVGQQIPWQVEFDDHNMAKLGLTGEVRWCRPIEGGYTAGIQFVEVNKATYSRLVHFVNWLSQMERGVIKDDYGRLR